VPRIIQTFLGRAVADDRRRRRSAFLAFVLGIFVSAFACDREAESRAEARGLLERLNKLSANGSLADRQRALDAVEQFAVREPKHAQARDVCRSAHLQLLQAEAAQVSARKSLDEATRAAVPGSAPLSAERGQAIAAELQRSNEALVAAQKAFPKCEQATLELTREGR
jgi:hypothetical protein